MPVKAPAWKKFINSGATPPKRKTAFDHDLIVKMNNTGFPLVESKFKH